MKMRMRMTTILTSFFGLTIMSRSLLSWMCVIDSVLPHLAQASCKYVSGGTSLSCQRGHTRRLPDNDEQSYWDGLLPSLLHPVHEPGSTVYLSKGIPVFDKVVTCICLLFYILFMNQGTCIWMSYTLIASTSLAIPAMAFVKEHYNRTNVDEVVFSTRR